MGTVKQKKAAKAYVENMRNKNTKPLGKVFTEAGYSAVTATHPATIINQKGFQEELEELIPNADVAEEHDRLFKAYKYSQIDFPGDLAIGYVKSLLRLMGAEKIKVVSKDKNENTQYWQAHCLLPDNRLRKDMLEMTHKVKGNFSPEMRMELNPYAQLTDAELDQLLEEEKSK